jgi:hypothetical protein
MKFKLRSFSRHFRTLLHSYESEHGESARLKFANLISWHESRPIFFAFTHWLRKTAPNQENVTNQQFNYATIQGA